MSLLLPLFASTHTLLYAVSQAARENGAHRRLGSVESSIAASMIPDASFETDKWVWIGSLLGVQIGGTVQLDAVYNIYGINLLLISLPIWERRDAPIDSLLYNSEEIYFLSFVCFGGGGGRDRVTIYTISTIIYSR